MKNIHFYTVVLALISVVAAQTPCGSTTCEAGDACCTDRVIGQVCFHPSNFACVLNEKLCSIDQNVCFDTVCFDPNIHVCLFNGLNQFLCPKGTIGCGPNNICLDPAHYACLNGQVVQRPSTLACGNSSCDAPQQCCNGVCFDPTTHACAIAEGVAGLVCPINSKGKANGVCNLSSGAACFDMDIQRCLPISSVHQLCNISDPTCVATVLANTVGAQDVTVPPSMLQTSAVTSVAISAATSAQTSIATSGQTSVQTVAATSVATSIATSAQTSVQTSVQTSGETVAATSAATSQVTSAVIVATSAQTSQATSLGQSVATSAVVPSASVLASVFSSVITSLATAATAIVTSVVSTTTAIIEATASTTTATVAVTSAVPTSATVLTTQTVAVETSSTAVLVTQGSGAASPEVALVSLFFGLALLLV